MIVATLESVLILDKAEQLAKAIICSDIAEDYRKYYRNYMKIWNFRRSFSNLQR